jgi:hypothetical protein
VVAKTSLGKPYLGSKDHVLFDAITYGDGKLAFGFFVNGILVEYGHTDVHGRKFGTYFFHLPQSGRFNLKTGDIVEVQIKAGYFVSTTSKEVQWAFESKPNKFVVK